ncbi:MopE-related protein [Polyangium spumosum]|nr:MopE-related protein [Polyangium spumosum]
MGEWWFRGWAATIATTVLAGAAGCAQGTTPPVGFEQASGGGGGAGGGGGSGGEGGGGEGGGMSPACGIPEVCNGVDDDCDGLVDEDIASLGGPCDTKLFGVCGVGVSGCDGGQVFCVPTNQPTPEVCDGLDNNCDGVIDEDDPGGGAACDSGLFGPCAAGTAVCMSGALTCSPAVLPVGELCDDGVDNNCDGDVDEGCSAAPPVCAHDPCVAGGPLDPLCDPCVNAVCVIDKTCCKASWDVFCVGTAQVHCACP